MKSEPVNIVIITQDAPLYLGGFLDDVLQGLRDLPCRVSAVVVLSPLFRKSRLAEMRERWHMLGGLDFLKMIMHILREKWLSRLASWGMIGGCHSVQNAISRHGVKRVDRAEINDLHFIDWLKSSNTGILVSIACPKIMKPGVLAAPSLCAINYHTGMLPRYRGRQPLFWALLNDESHVGITIHEMAPELDAGPIIVQEAVPVQGEKSLHGVYLKTLKPGARLLVEAVRKLLDGDTTRLPNDATGEPCYRFPKREDGEKFRASGKSYYK